MNNQNQVKSSNDAFKVVLIGFEYDKATKLTFPWIADEKFLATYPNDKIHRFHNGSKKEQKRLKDLLNSEKESESITVEIFLGHGSDEALLGPPNKSSQQKHSPFYEMNMISSLPSSLFAYSCFSAQKFGRKYIMSENKVFMGFMDKVFLSYEIEVLTQLKNIFQQVAEDIIKAGKIKKSHETKFKRLIYGLMQDIDSGKISCKFPKKVVESYLMPYIDAMKII